MAIFCTWDHHPLAFAVDAFSVTWNQFAWFPKFWNTWSGTLSGTCNSDSPTMAKKTLLSRSTAVVNCKPNQVNKTRLYIIRIPRMKMFSLNAWLLSTDNSANGFPQDVRNLLSASWRASTQKDYSGKFKQFSSWCRGKQIDTYSASLTGCAEFLSFLFHKGLQYRTIAGYRSMLSSVLQPANNISVGQHPHIVRLIKGIFNSRPPTTKLLPEWELPLVLDL